MMLSALPRTAHPHTASCGSAADRDDLVSIDGVLHTVHDDLTPALAHEADLLAVADALEATGMPLLLIRHDREHVAIVVDLAHVDAATAALRELGVREPFCVKGRRESITPLPEWTPSGEPAALRVFRPRITATGGLRYGTSTGVRVEFWRFGEEVIEAPHDNALTRRAFPRDEFETTTVDRFGRSWLTIAGMFDPLPNEVDFDVDIVFSWVDGSSTEFQRRRAARMAEYVVGEGDDGPARYRHVDELRYALRSVHMYAPWVRRIFIATDSPQPAWLAEHPRVTIVRSEEFFADTSVLPTHNSHAVESQLHRIEGLAEHFLYSNDDMFFGRPVRPEMFFTSAGVSQFVECDVRIGTGPALPHRSGHDNALRVNRDLLKRRFGRTITRDLEHCATPLRRSVVAELGREFPEEIARTAASPFRSATDVSVTNCLYHYYALFTGRALPTAAPRVQYVQTTQNSSLRQLSRLVSRRDADMFCLNDGGSAEVPEELRVRVVCDALERMFPVAAPWEKADAGAAAGDDGTDIGAVVSEAPESAWSAARFVADR